MNLLPLPTRLPARKHVLAASLMLLSISLMAAAVLGATGLPSPFRSGGLERVSTGGVLVNAPDETTTTVPSSETTLKPPEAPRSVASPTATTVPRSSNGGPATTQPPSTTSTTIGPNTPNDLVGGLLGGVGSGRGESNNGVLGGP
jgi:hypothetical protein